MKQLEDTLKAIRREYNVSKRVFDTWLKQIRKELMEIGNDHHSPYLTPAQKKFLYEKLGHPTKHVDGLQTLAKKYNKSLTTFLSWIKPFEEQLSIEGNGHSGRVLTPRQRKFLLEKLGPFPVRSRRNKNAA